MRHPFALEPWYATNKAITIYFLIFTLLLIGGGCLLARSICTAKWEDSGRAPSWGVLTGCRIQRPDGAWVPADAYREVTP